MKHYIFIKRGVLIAFFLTSNSILAETNYITAPHIIKNESFPERITSTPLNQHIINHKTKGNASLTGLYGSDRDYNLFPNVLYNIKSEVEQSLSTDQVFTSDQRGHYVQLMSVVKNQNITLSKTEAQTMIGQAIQMSFTGSCSIISDHNSNDQCLFTPSMITDRNSLDANSIPTKFLESTRYGEVVSKETLAILAQPGFQSLGANGQRVGIDLYFPNSGRQAGNTQSKETTMTRKDRITTTPLFGYSRVRKILKANYEKTVMGLTIHGFGASWDSDNVGINLGIGAAAQFLPDVIPSLSGSDKKVSTDINLNLLNAANNTRLPLNSWTIYQAGLGAADHPTTENGIRITPTAYFNTFWLGLSPVRESSFSFDTRQEFTGAEKIIINAGGEGGKLDNVSFVSAVNDQKTTSGQLESFYVQAYLQFLNRDMNLISTTKLNYTTTYYPHLSYSGNVTGSNFAARYYGGVILSKHMKPYIGADYTHNWKGWAFHGNAIYYYNQNQEYYSHAEGSLSKNFNIWKGYGLTLHSSARYAFERRVQQFLEEPIDNFVDAGVSLNFSHWATLGASYYFGDLLPDSIESAWKYNASLRPWKYIAFSAFFSPYNSQHTYGASMSINSATHPERVALTLGWQHQVYEYGEDAFGEDLKSEHDVFSANINFQF